MVLRHARQGISIDRMWRLVDKTYQREVGLEREFERASAVKQLSRVRQRLNEGYERACEESLALLRLQSVVRQREAAERAIAEASGEETEFFKEVRREEDGLRHVIEQSEAERAKSGKRLEGYLRQFLAALDDGSIQLSDQPKVCCPLSRDIHCEIVYLFLIGVLREEEVWQLFERAIQLFDSASDRFSDAAIDAKSQDFVQNIGYRAADLSVFYRQVIDGDDVAWEQPLESEVAEVSSLAEKVKQTVDRIGARLATIDQRQEAHRDRTERIRLLVEQNGPCKPKTD